LPRRGIALQFSAKDGYHPYIPLLAETPLMKTGAVLKFIERYKNERKYGIQEAL
jgi:hypothetical protein